ncbi:MAG: DUF1460 domain-containing protein [Verrucomicrobia bacterium]|nr:DUF1460 domain-containing protein [Verrucomicrobiota bacterium]
MRALVSAFALLVAVSASTDALPYSVVFRGSPVFQHLVAKAESEGWRSLPLGDRTIAVAKSFLGVPYINYTLEIDDRVEAPSVDLWGMDCWTFFEISVGFARMLAVKSSDYTPADLLAMIELDRYRGGRCTGSYLSRLHFLEDWAQDNQRRGLVRNITRELGGELIRGRYVDEMSRTWRSSRYLRNDPALLPSLRQMEDHDASLRVYQIPRDRVAGVESEIQSGDVICITGRGPEGYTEHFGLAYRDGSGVLHFMHASKDEHRVVIDVPIHQYLYRYHRFAGIMVVRPLDVPSSQHNRLALK